MSIKQFVSIVNYFLHFIAGNRLTVGINHVEDIVNVLQKLQYPYAINKSWLKTPNTQHSFGHVVTLLSWLMDFVQPSGDDDNLGGFFPLQDTQDMTDNVEGRSFIVDNDFQLQMIQHCEEAFNLWDKHLMREYSEMQQKTCDLYISKQCNFKSLASLDCEIQQLRKTLETLKKQNNPVPKKLVENQKNLLDEHKKLLQIKQNLEKDLSNIADELTQLNEQLNNCQESIFKVEQEIAQLKKEIKTQKYTVEQRGALFEELDQLTHILQAEERTIRELEEHNYRQQIDLSRLKKKQTDTIEQFNARVRNDILSDARTIDATNYNNLLVPLKMEHQQSLENTNKLLLTKKEKLVELIAAEKLKLNDITNKLAAVEEEISTIIRPENEMIASKLKLTENAYAQEEAQQQHNLENLLQQQQQLKVQINQNELTLTQLKNEIECKQQQLLLKQKLNNTIMTEAEERHLKRSKQREEFLNAFSKQLDEQIPDLLVLEKLVHETN